MVARGAAKQVAENERLRLEVDAAERRQSEEEARVAAAVARRKKAEEDARQKAEEDEGKKIAAERATARMSERTAANAAEASADAQRVIALLASAHDQFERDVATMDQLEKEVQSRSLPTALLRNMMGKIDGQRNNAEAGHLTALRNLCAQLMDSFEKQHDIHAHPIVVSIGRMCDEKLPGPGRGKQRTPGKTRSKKLL